uniref:MHC class II beta chain N-terminal domain-containing protein n=1 Tax=Periophthalmus magnuspinnatus TaxID=409849 RepID=A0A3B4BBU9_9GOBI
FASSFLHKIPCNCIHHIFLNLSGVAHYVHGTETCRFSAEDDVVFSAQLYYNKQLFASFNSTTEKFTGYTKEAKDIADGLNQNPRALREMKYALKTCKELIPEVLKSVQAAGNFTENEEEVTSGVTFTDEMSNGNWLYQKHSYLEYTPTAADHISCMVEHASLRTPKLYPWGMMSPSFSLLNSFRSFHSGSCYCLLGLILTIPLMLIIDIHIAYLCHSLIQIVKANRNNQVNHLCIYILDISWQSTM